MDPDTQVSVNSEPQISSKNQAFYTRSKLDQSRREAFSNRVPTALVKREFEDARGWLGTSTTRFYNEAKSHTINTEIGKQKPSHGFSYSKGLKMEQRALLKVRTTIYGNAKSTLYQIQPQASGCSDQEAKTQTIVDEFDKQKIVLDDFDTISGLGTKPFDYSTVKDWMKGKVFEDSYSPFYKNGKLMQYDTTLSYQDIPVTLTCSKNPLLKLETVGDVFYNFGSEYEQSRAQYLLYSYTDGDPNALQIPPEDSKIHTLTQAIRSRFGHTSHGSGHSSQGTSQS
ncbi:uncharacterized protein IL334_005006 [Kwoniella shivajii]|uniref:Uncharacterized protein n=1 Tax=Kwoniella shivajii TaxID=564305 RepID=A0ABZ1D4Y3_9TREE|nr:hypothetical protein IL334_005006 [Kwoniella shivajii]